MSDQISPVTIAVSDEQLADLKHRLANVRWPEGRTVTESQHEILRAAACEPATPALPFTV